MANIVMTAKQLARRKQVVLGNVISKTYCYKDPKYQRRRAYFRGDMRCTNCKKWLNPDNPKEAQEIKIFRGGKKQHDIRYCSVYSVYPAVLVMFPKFHGTRKKRLDGIKRY